MSSQNAIVSKGNRWILYGNKAVKLSYDEGRVVEFRMRRLEGRNYQLDCETVLVDTPVYKDKLYAIIFVSNGYRLFSRPDFNNYFGRFSFNLVKMENSDEFERFEAKGIASRLVNEIQVEEARLVYQSPKTRVSKMYSKDRFELITDDSVVIDYGCGDGRRARELMKKRRIRRMICVDVMDEGPVGMEYYKVDEVGKIGKGVADYVLCLMVIHHSNDVNKLMFNINWLLKVDGMLFVDEHCANNEEMADRINAQHALFKDQVNDPVRYYSVKELFQLFSCYSFITRDFYSKRYIDESKYEIMHKKMPEGLLPVLFSNHESGTRVSRVSAIAGYMADLRYPRFNKYLVFGFPGSGKTTFMNNLTRKTGYKCIDTDDFLKDMANISDRRKFHEIAFHAATIYNAETPTVILTNYHSDLFLAYMRKDMYTLIAVKLEYNEWKRRFNEREDLLKADMPWEKWYLEVDYSKFDMVVNDFNVIEDLIYLPLQISAFGHPINHLDYKFLISQMPLMNDMGHYVRKSIMMWVKRLGKTYVGLGDEIESVIDADQVGVKARHVGLPESKYRDVVGLEAMRKIERMNFYDMDLDDYQDSIFVSLWAISNIMNRGLRRDVDWLEGRSFILMYPNIHAGRLYPYGLGNNYISGKTVKSKRGDRLYVDMMSDPYELLIKDSAYCMSLPDFLGYINHDIEGTYVGPSDRFFVSRGNFHYQLWYIVFSKDLLTHHEYQTWYNSQTHSVRLVSIPIRRYLAVDSASLHQFRRLAMRLIFENKIYETVTFENPRVTGHLKINNVVHTVAVSGHLINLLMYSVFGVVDFIRYFDTIEGNLRLHESKGRIPTSAKILVGRELLAEDNEKSTLGRLWHSYYDFYIAIGAYILLASSLRFPFNVRGVRYCLRRLLKLKHKYKSFTDDGWQAREYLANERTLKK